MAKPSLVLGTAGHIDHGKSSLVLALTGKDPDRLIEEKKRGITIELGFAQLILPGGTTMGVVDVPGHERFVRQMVSGATGVDVALLVIAADDGIMPQTTEHLWVLELLGVKTCVVALTKIDLVDEEWIEFLSDEIRARLADTPYADAPLVGVSSKTGEGLEELKAAIEAAAKSTQSTKEQGAARMPVDRVFTIKGAGTVVTGTLWSGQISAGEDLEVLPRGKRSRVRSLQMHDTSFDTVTAGNRVAINLPDLTTEKIRPGDFLCAPGSCVPTDHFDARLTYADPFKSGKPLVTGCRVHVAHGTKEVIGRVLLDNGVQSAAPGESLLVQIRLETPLAVALHDRFVIRSYSPVHVIGGGEVLAAHPRRRTNLSETETKLLNALELGDSQQAIDAQLDLEQYPVTLETLSKATGLNLTVVTTCVNEAISQKKALWVGSAGQLVCRPAKVQKFVSAVESHLMKFHNANPEATGVPKEALRQAINPKMDKAVFEALLQEAERAGKAVQSEGEVSHPKTGAGAKAKEREAANALFALMREADAAPVPLGDMAAQANLSKELAGKAARALLADGRAIRLDETTYYAASVIERHKAAIASWVQEHGPSKAADLKDAMGISRKYAIPLLEYFDATGFTKRDGDFRSL